MSQAPAGLYSRLDQNVEPEPTTTSPQPSQVTLPPQEPTPTSAPRTKPREKFKLVLYKLGITEIILGVLSIILCIVTLGIASTNKTYKYYSSWSNETYNYRIRYSATYASQGIWCGAVVLACGILGLKTRNRPSVCMYNVNMTMSIVGAFMMATLGIMSAVCAGTTSPRDETRAITAVHSVLAVIGFSGMIICIIHSAYCCAGVCCRKKPVQGVVLYAAHPAYQQQQQMVQVQLANGQYIMVPAQSVAAGPSHYQPGQMPAPAPPYPPMSKEQEAQMSSSPPAYTASPSHGQV